MDSLIAIFKGFDAYLFACIDGSPIKYRRRDRCFFCARFWTGRFLMGKTINDRFANKELRPSGICLGATWAGIFSQKILILGS